MEFSVLWILPHMDRFLSFGTRKGLRRDWCLGVICVFRDLMFDFRFYRDSSPSQIPEINKGFTEMD